MGQLRIQLGEELDLIDKNKFLGYLICHFGILFGFCIMFDIVILLIITFSQD